MRGSLPHPFHNLASWPYFTVALAALVAPSRSFSTPPDAAEVDRLIRELGNKRYSQRVAATTMLKEVGEPALEALRQAATSSQDAEVRKRAKDLIRAIENRMAAREKAKAIAMLHRLGGKWVVDRPNPDEPAFLQQLGFENHWQQHRSDEPVVYVDLSHTKVQDADLAALRGLKDLEVLICSDTEITDAGLVYVRGLHQLRALDLAHTRVTGAGLVHLCEMRQLRSLYFTGTPVTNRGLVHLEKHCHLRLLDLSSTKVSDCGLVHLKKLGRLNLLYLYKTQVTDNGLRQLIELPALQCLSVGQTNVTDTGVAAFTKVRPDVRVNR